MKQPDFAFEKTDEIRHALSLLNAPASKHPLIFITGKAGTGKTTLLRYFVQQTTKNVIVLATTGLAAVHVHGQTIHSFFHIKPGNLLDLEQFKKLPRRIVEAIDTLIIDEASMLRADLLDAIDYILRISTRNDTPFGGKQLLLFGDLFQLPPIEDTPGSGLFDYFRMAYKSPYFFDAHVVQKTGIEVFELTRIFRQQDDSRFAALLNKIRANHITQAELDTWINKRKTPDEPTDLETSIILSPTNASVTRRNHVYLEKLDGPVYSYPALIDGSF